MTGLEVAVGFLIAWFARKAGRVGKRIDGLTDEMLDAGLDRLHDLVSGKLGADPALKQLEAEAWASGDARTRTRDRVRLALEEATERDPAFATDLVGVLEKLRSSPAAGARGVAIGGDVRADGGGVAIVMTGGSVNVAPPDPFGPGGQSPRT